MVTHSDFSPARRLPPAYKHRRCGVGRRHLSRDRKQQDRKSIGEKEHRVENNTGGKQHSLAMDNSAHDNNIASPNEHARKLRSGSAADSSDQTSTSGPTYHSVYLAPQIAQLQAKLFEFSELTRNAAAQYKQMQSLGTTHASILIGSQMWMEREAFGPEDSKE